MVVRFVRAVLNVVVFTALAVAIGAATSRYAIEQGTRWSVRTSGPWMQWITAGRPDADPYARAHTARMGELPITSSIESSFRATSDSSGAGLSAACEYVIVLGHGNTWWNVAAYGSEQGQLVSNAADRYAFNARTAMRDIDGSATIVLAREARAGNWLPIGGDGPLHFVLTMLDPAGGGNAAMALPDIQRVGCR